MDKMFMIELEQGALNMRFGNGHSLSLALDELPDDIIRRLALHGLASKLRLAAAYAPTAAIAAARARQVMEALRQGRWTARQPAREGATSLLERAIEAALLRMGRRPPEDLGAKLRALDRSARAKLRAAPEVAVELARLRGAQGPRLEDILGQ